MPLHTKDSRDQECSYCDVSILPAFPKVMEKVRHAHLGAFLDANAVLTESQYGFRGNRSTADAVV